MDVGDLVMVRFAVFRPDGFGVLGMKWTLGVIIKDDEYQAGLYKVYVFEYEKEQKIFINDLIPLKDYSTIYEGKVEDT
jgi:hypothetical protein